MTAKANTDINNLFAKYFGAVDWVISKIPYDKLPKWKRFFLMPEEVVSEGPETIVSNIKNIYVSILLGILSTMPQLIASIIFFLLFALIEPPPVGLYVVLILIVLILFILDPLLFLIWAGIEYITAKLFKSSADFKTHFNASILPTLSNTIVLFPLNFVTSVFIALSMIPVAGLACSIFTYPLLAISLLVWLYIIIYLRYRAFKVVHRLDTLKTAIVTLIVPILAIIFVMSIVILVFLFYGLIFATIFDILAKSVASS